LGTAGINQACNHFASKIHIQGFFSILGAFFAVLTLDPAAIASSIVEATQAGFEIYDMMNDLKVCLFSISL